LRYVFFIDSFKVIRNSPEVLNFNRLFFNSTGLFVTNCRFSPIVAYELTCVRAHEARGGTNVWGELVFSVMEAGWFCEKVRLNWESGGCETGAFKTETGFQPATVLRRRIFTRMSCEIGGLPSNLIHLGPDIIWF
jgi:hypothetical protein